MKAAVWHGVRDIRIERHEPLPLGPADVRIDVALCGICGSDLHEYASGPHGIPVGEPHPLSGRSAPLIIGHEFCGTVTEVGPAASGLQPGQRVTIEPAYRCGRCAGCRRGDYNLCDSMGFAGLMGDGGMATETVVPGYMAHPLPDSVSFAQAAMLEPAAVALHALRRAGLKAGESCVVIGAGPIGLLIVQLAKLAGAEKIIVSDTSDARLALAGKVGADIVVNPARQDLAAAATQATGGVGIDLSFEAVGLQPALDDAFRVLRKGGRLVLVGLFVDNPTIDAFEMVNREIDIVSSVGYRDVFPELIAMVADGRFNPSAIVTRTIALDDVVAEGFERLLSNPADVKILVRPG